jgi:hypothetical protein|tara:strand:+ start:1376 stop:1525 length:150 start_codon:yes stop_codon:yes gene_type:complete
MFSGFIITFIPKHIFYTKTAHLPGQLKHAFIFQKESSKIGGSGLRSGPS